MKNKPVRDLNIVGDFLKYSGLLFIPLFILGVIYGLIYECYFTCFIVNPIIYSIGISMIIIVLQHDVNEIQAVFGFGKKAQLSYHITYAKEVQEIGLLMSTKDFQQALKKADKLVKKEPKFTNALNLKGEILLQGFKNYSEARQCFDQVLNLTSPDDEQYKLAENLKAATYSTNA